VLSRAYTSGSLPCGTSVRGRPHPHRFGSEALGPRRRSLRVCPPTSRRRPTATRICSPRRLLRRRSRRRRERRWPTPPPSARRWPAPISRTAVTSATMTTPSTRWPPSPTATPGSTPAHGSDCSTSPTRVTCSRSDRRRRHGGHCSGASTRWVDRFVPEQVTGPFGAGRQVRDDALRIYGLEQSALPTYR